MFKFVVLAVVVGLAAAQLHLSQEAGAQIKSLGSDIHPDGSYQYAFETSNGIAAQEQGIGGVHASGQASHVAPDGTPIQLIYTADENGFHPQGAHLPQPHPIPDYILRSLEWNAAHPEEEREDYVVKQQRF